MLGTSHRFESETRYFSEKGTNCESIVQFYRHLIDCSWGIAVISNVGYSGGEFVICEISANSEFIEYNSILPLNWDEKMRQFLTYHSVLRVVLFGLSSLFKVISPQPRRGGALCFDPL